MSRKNHPHIRILKEQLVEGRIDRREFLRLSTLLGLSATAAYGFVGKVFGDGIAAPARAAMPKGGTLRIAMRVKEITDPHIFDWAEKSNVCRQVCEYLTKTGHDNITRPYLLEGWEVSDDLRTWTLRLRKGIKWHSGRDFVADDVVWNLRRVLDPATGSSVLGLMAGYMMNDDGTALWDANAIEKVDDHTVRLNAKAPQVAVPEHLFHYPLLILDPEEGGKFGPGSNGTGAFELTAHEVGRKSVLKARSDYWGEGPYLDGLEFVDLGDDPNASMAALSSRQVHGLFSGDVLTFDAMKQLDFVQMYDAVTAETGVVRGKVTEKPFDDPRVRKALRLAIDSEKVTAVALRSVGVVGEHHHVSPAHPEYAKLPAWTRDVDAAKKLLAEAGYPDGIEVTLTCPADIQWMPIAAQVMAEQWKEANINVKLDVVPGAQYWDVWTKVPMGFTIWYHRPLAIMCLGLGYRTGAPWNESSYSNKTFDDLLTKAEGMLDVDERRKVVAELERIMQEDGPIVQPMWRSVFTFYDKRVKGFRMHPSNYIFGNELALEA